MVACFLHLCFERNAAFMANSKENAESQRFCGQLVKQSLGCMMTEWVNGRRAKAASATHPQTCRLTSDNREHQHNVDSFQYQYTWIKIGMVCSAPSCQWILGGKKAEMVQIHFRYLQKEILWHTWRSLPSLGMYSARFIFLITPYIRSLPSSQVSTTHWICLWPVAQTENLSRVQREPSSGWSPPWRPTPRKTKSTQVFAWGDWTKLPESLNRHHQGWSATESSCRNKGRKVKGEVKGEVTCSVGSWHFQIFIFLPSRVSFICWVSKQLTQVTCKTFDEMLNCDILLAKIKQWLQRTGLWILSKSH